MNPMPTCWCSATLRAESVWVGIRNARTRQPALVEGLVPFRYSADRGARVYRTRRAEFTADMIPTVRELPPGVWADAPGASQEVRDLKDALREARGEVHTARIRIAGLEALLRLARQGKPKAELPVDVDELLKLCHPDLHPPARAEIANRVTARLLDLRRGR